MERTISSQVNPDIWYSRFVVNCLEPGINLDKRLFNPRGYILDKGLGEVHAPSSLDCGIVAAADIAQREGTVLIDKLPRHFVKPVGGNTDEELAVVRAVEAFTRILSIQTLGEPSNNLGQTSIGNMPAIARWRGACADAEGFFNTLLNDLQSGGSLEPGMVIVDEAKRPVAIKKNPSGTPRVRTVGEYYGEPTALTLRPMTVNGVPAPKGSLVAVEYKSAPDGDRKIIVSAQHVEAVRFLRLGRLSTREQLKTGGPSPLISIDEARRVIEKVMQSDRVKLS